MSKRSNTSSVVFESSAPVGSSANNIAGLLISKNGSLIFENYYNGSYEEEIYPIFSVTKSFLSTIVGQAHDMGLIPDPDLPMSNFLSEDIDYLNDITLSNLLTMTSGYIPIDNYLYATTYELANASHSSGPGSFFYQNPQQNNKPLTSKRLNPKPKCLNPNPVRATA